MAWNLQNSSPTVSDDTKRKELLDRTVTEGWTCTELAHEVKNANHPTASDGRGRPMTSPTTFDGAVAQQQQKAEEWDRRHTKVWGASDRTLGAHAAKLAPDEVTDERLRQARELASQLRRVADQAVKQAEQAEQVVQDFERILNERQQAQVPV